MKKALIIAMLAAIGLAAQAPASTKAKAPQKAKTAKTPVAAKKVTSPPGVTIPVDATANPDGSYSWTDKQGKKWVFVKSPFGIMKSAAPSAPVDSAPLAGVKTFDEGDKVRFESASPFGVMKREKNKTELTDDERKLYESQHPGPTAKQE